MKKRKPKNRENKLRRDSDDYTHLQKPSTTARVVFTYIKTPMAFISSWQWVEVNVKH
jgi:hypothetical protein